MPLPAIGSPELQPSDYLQSAQEELQKIQTLPQTSLAEITQARKLANKLTDRIWDARTQVPPEQRKAFTDILPQVTEWDQDVLKVQEKKAWQQVLNQAPEHVRKVIGLSPAQNSEGDAFSVRYGNHRTAATLIVYHQGKIGPDAVVGRIMGAQGKAIPLTAGKLNELFQTGKLHSNNDDGRGKPWINTSKVNDIINGFDIGKFFDPARDSGVGISLGIVEPNTRRSKYSEITCNHTGEPIAHYLMRNIPVENIPKLELAQAKTVAAPKMKIYKINPLVDLFDKTQRRAEEAVIALRDIGKQKTVFADALPDTTPANENTASIAAHRLHMVLAQNKKAGTLAVGITTADAETIVEYAALKTKHNLKKSYANSGFPAENKPFEKLNLQGACGFASSMAHYTLENFGLQPLRPQIGNLVDDKDRHAFSVVRIPVDVNGQVTEKGYLIDTTYKQFCTYYPAPLAKEGGTPLNQMPGYFLNQTEEGRQLATQLLTRGYAELTGRNAQLYVDSFNRNPTFVNHEAYLAALHNPRNEQAHDDTAQELQAKGYDVSAPKASTPAPAGIKIKPGENKEGGFVLNPAAVIAEKLTASQKAADQLQMPKVIERASASAPGENTSRVRPANGISR